MSMRHDEMSICFIGLSKKMHGLKRQVTQTLVLQHNKKQK